MWFGNPGPPVSGPGSKNPEPPVDVPVIVTGTDDWPGRTVLGLADAGVAGGGAFSWITRTPQTLFALAYSWNVQNVWSSVGSTTVWEKSPHRRGDSDPRLWVLELDWVSWKGSVGPLGSVASRPDEAISGERPTPAVLMLSEACPWPLMAIDGIQKKRGLEATVSNSVPDWIRL